MVKSRKHSDFKRIASALVFTFLVSTIPSCGNTTTESVLVENDEESDMITNVTYKNVYYVMYRSLIYTSSYSECDTVLNCNTIDLKIINTGLDSHIIKL